MKIRYCIVEQNHIHVYFKDGGPVRLDKIILINAFKIKFCTVEQDYTNTYFEDRLEQDYTHVYFKNR